jgi:hypothetical protein
MKRLAREIISESEMNSKFPIRSSPNSLEARKKKLLNFVIRGTTRGGDLEYDFAFLSEKEFVDGVTSIHNFITFLL